MKKTIFNFINTRLNKQNKPDKYPLISSAFCHQFPLYNAKILFTIVSVVFPTDFTDLFYNRDNQRKQPLRRKSICLCCWLSWQ